MTTLPGSARLRVDPKRSVNIDVDPVTSDAAAGVCEGSL
jgi:hypothetical protein